jgi:hypothetical protein
MREWITAVKDKASSRSQIVGVPGAVVKPVLSVLEQVRLAPLRKDQFLIADLEYYMDASLAKKELGWSPKKSGLEVMMDTFEW